MIRTKVVELSVMEAVAYRRKLRGGHTGIVIMRYDQEQPGLAQIDRNTGVPHPAAHINIEHYPLAAFEEAVELTSGLPYSQRGAIKLSASQESDEDAPEPEADVAVRSEDYAAIVKAYTNRRGELSYELLNKDFIQFAKSSRVVSQMVADQASDEAIRNHIVRSKLETLTKNRDLSDGQIQQIVNLLDEVSPRYVFRDLTSEIRRMLARS